MNNLNENVSAKIDRMKAMMSYGLKTESKPYSSVEYERAGADGNMYAIIREGAKYHIKTANKKKPLKEDYSYIGGFANHKTYMFDSYANALKHFDMKMSSINEAVGKHGKTDSWNVNERNNIIAESSEKMRLEIARQREIMKNANMIAEGKKCNMEKSAAKDIEKNNFRMTKPQIGTAQNQGGDFFTEKPQGSDLENVGETEKNNIKGKQQPVVENVENEFMDAPLSGGINLNVGSNNKGDGAGQTNVMGGGLNGGLGEDEEFEENEFDAEVDDTIDGEEEEIDVDDEELEEFPDEDEEEFEDLDVEDEETDDISSLRAEIESLRSTIDAMAEKLGVDEFDTDEPLYDDDADESFDDEEETEYELETEIDDEDEDDDYEESEEEDETVYESRSYRQLMEAKMMDTIKKIGKKATKKVKNYLKDLKDFDERDLAPNFSNTNKEDWDEYDERQRQKKEKKGKELDETTLHVFGKHPRFKKEPMTYPTPRMEKKEGQYEEGADTDETNKPYATSIGDSTPFGDGEKVKVAVNSIAEAVLRKLSKNL